MREVAHCDPTLVVAQIVVSRPTMKGWPRTNEPVSRHGGLLLAVFLILASVTQAADWPQYRGPNHDGGTPESIRTDWAERPPQVLWRRAFEPGFSSVVASGGRLFTLVKRVAREHAVGLDAATGAELWAVNLDRAQYTDLAGYSNHMDGPRSTPSVDGDRVYVFTSYLKLYALRADTGAVIWMRDFVAELGSAVIAWENAASPLVLGDLIFLNSNAEGRRLMALNKTDGTTVWSSANDVMTHATPVPGRIHDTDQIIFLTRSGLVSVVPETGAALWRLGFTPSFTSTASSPVVAGNYVHASAAYAAGTWVGRVSKSGSAFSATQVYRQRGNAFQIHWATPVHHAGFIYAVASPSSFQARLVCLDVPSGVNRWERAQVGSGNIGFGSLIKAANTLIVLTESGELVLVEPNPAAYTETARFKALDAFCWNHPTLSEGRLYVRSTAALASQLVALDVGVPRVPLPPMTLSVQRLPESRGLRLSVRAGGGSSFQPGDAARLELLASPRLTAPWPEWFVIPGGFVLQDEALVADVTDLGNGALFLVVRIRAAAN